VDTETKEMAIGSATCLTQFDLQFNLPAVIVDVGGACAQSVVDTGATNRMRIHEQLLLGTPPEEIILILEQQDVQHQSRQYGIVDVLGRAATFTGTQAGAHASGVVGQSGSLVYAIQGNVLTGAPVVLEAEAAVLNTPGDLPEKLMAAMEAAYLMGGDGRCSCTVLDPTFCGSPPPVFDKSAHIGFMIDTRTGDTDGVCTTDDGCANGDYFMNFNVPNQQPSDPDPVLQLREAFDAWRADLVGEPDAVQSSATLDSEWIRARWTASTTLTITVRDWQGVPVTDESLSVSVGHTPDSDQVSIPSEVVSDGDGVFHVLIRGTTSAGVDRFRVTAYTLGGQVIILPMPTLRVAALEDLDGDGDVDLADHATMVDCVSGPGVPPGAECGDADIDLDDDVDLRDLASCQAAYTNSACRELEVVEQPQRADLCVGDPLTLSVGVSADPEPTYKWRRNGVLIPGATESTFFIEAVDENDWGFYSVDVTNTCGTVSSESVPVRVASGVGPCP
jgi:hypothetical protein